MTIKGTRINNAWRDGKLPVICTAYTYVEWMHPYVERPYVFYFID